MFMDLTNLNGLIEELGDIHSSMETPTYIYTVEECSELQKELMKVQRKQGKIDFVVEEACDVMLTTLMLLRDLDVDDETIVERMEYKARRAISEFHKKELGHKIAKNTSSIIGSNPKLY